MEHKKISESLLSKEYVEWLSNQKREKKCLNLKSKFFDNRSHIIDMFDFGKKYN